MVDVEPMDSSPTSSNSEFPNQQSSEQFVNLPQTSSSKFNSFSVPTNATVSSIKREHLVDSPPPPHFVSHHQSSNRDLVQPIALNGSGPSSLHVYSSNAGIKSHMNPSPLKINIPDHVEANYMSPFPSPTGTIR